MKSEKRRERELMRRAEAQRLWRPGDDHHDMVLKTWWVVPGFYIFWMALCRIVKAIGQRDRKTPPSIPAREPSPLQWGEAASQRPRRQLWTVGPKPLE